MERLKMTRLLGFIFLIGCGFLSLGALAIGEGLAAIGAGLAERSYLYGNQEEFFVAIVVFQSISFALFVFELIGVLDLVRQAVGNLAGRLNRRNTSSLKSEPEATVPHPHESGQPAAG